MINTAKLRGRIVESGYSQCSFAKNIKMSEYTLHKKIYNKSAMTLPEAETFAILLGIPDSEFGEYFFYTPVA